MKSQFMRLQQQFCQYVWLVDTLRHEALTLEQLSEKWKETEISGGLPLSRTTFNRMRDAVQDMFGVIIECDLKNRYIVSQILKFWNAKIHMDIAFSPSSTRNTCNFAIAANAVPRFGTGVK